MHQQQIAIQKLTLGIGSFLLLIKFAAYFLTDSTTILTDALESIVNVVAGVFGLFSLYISARPKDENHPYGHGKIEFVAAAVEGSLIIIAGIGILGKSGYSLFYPNLVHNLDWGIAITAVAGLINFALGAYVSREGKKASSMVLVSSGEHLKSDGYSTIGMIVGLGLMLLTDWWWLDAVVAMVFGLVIIVAGIHVIQESLSGIMDEVDYDLVADIVTILDTHRHENCIDVHNLRVIKYGMALHVDCHITIPWYFNTREAHDQVDWLEDLLKDNTTKPIEFFVHVDPCTAPSCKVCTKQDCPVRQFDFEQKIEWNTQNIMLNQKHFCESQPHK